MVQAGTVVQLGVIVGAAVGLWVGSRAFVDATVRFARRVGMSELTIGLTIVAIGTATPEFVVTTDASLAGFGDIAVGNTVGSNIYNLAFILGVVSLLRYILVERSLIHRDGVALIASTLIGFAVLFDRAVVPREGIVLGVSFVVYTAYLVRDGRGDPTPEGKESQSRITHSVTERIAFRGRELLLLVGGLAVVLVSGHSMVEASSELAQSAGISEWETDRFSSDGEELSRRYPVSTCGTEVSIRRFTTPLSDRSSARC